ncbi:MAG: hypothetical protein INH34_02185 [Phycisphaerales bacterium]|jgi:hypothetical protein|nr:hypothetical protein [Phycisphaerales bacterium]
MHPTPTHNVPPTLSIRIDEQNPNHHLWLNHGWWWVHYVVHRGNRKERIRRSLQTRDLDAARHKRDELFARVRAAAAAPSARPAPADCAGPSRTPHAA